MNDLQQALLDSENGTSLNDVADIEVQHWEDGSFHRVLLHLKAGGSVEGLGANETEAGLVALKQVATVLDPPVGDKAALEE